MNISSNQCLYITVCLRSGTEAAVITNPFTCCVLPNFVKDEGFLKGLKEELLELDFNNKSNDLYKFQQVRSHFLIEMTILSVQNQKGMNSVPKYINKLISFLLQRGIFNFNNCDMAV